MAMMATTTSNSMSVNALRHRAWLTIAIKAFMPVEYNLAVCRPQLSNPFAHRHDAKQSRNAALESKVSTARRVAHPTTKWDCTLHSGRFWSPHPGLGHPTENRHHGLRPFAFTRV